MRTSSAAGAVIVLSVMTAAPTPVAAQVAPSDQNAPHRLDLEGGLFAAPAMIDAPFSAEAVTTWKPAAGSGRPELRTTSRMFRDRAGRVRLEQAFAGQPAGGGPHRIFVLPDPQRRIAFLLDPAARTAREVPAGLVNMSTVTPDRLVVPVSMRCVISFLRPRSIHHRQGGAPAEEALGQRVLLGVPAIGTRFAATLLWPDNTPPREMTDERWLSDALAIELSSRTEDPAIGVVEHEVTHLSLVEPSARLFEVPAGYEHAVPEWLPLPSGGVGREPFAWENPHALASWRTGAVPCELPSR